MCNTTQPTGNTTRATAASFRQLLEPPNKLTAKVTLYRRLIYSNYQLLFLFYYLRPSDCKFNSS
jgi:hypothetical protein